MENLKTPHQSSVETRHIVMPDQANHYGTLFGGTLMYWIDMIAVMVAQRHCGKEAVTASVDRLNFIAPIEVGDHVILKASVNYTGRTSMEVGVQVSKENPYTGTVVRATTAYLTFVALDESKKPCPVPQIKPETEDETRRFKNAVLRQESNRELVKKIRDSK
ncbi:acyl-CoA thioesterase [Leptospira stimsonii]|uniref:Acyl-CoA thioesterase n=1 Tax=Leptospira stimsonii TaxID=2202203 RepID=A0A4R9L3R1_9LEPT|nr:acyl-CoA thioesterase [Leptospira stimsonii]RHX92595.1 acyl-CoA thioesterase [Leptospira stimsonii]TGK23894.1 acyl-CoA thioesterase [Leptospira stimsonii]TGM10398.1 acyl-CoA thioesterase [Leptospira stimsonii]